MTKIKYIIAASNEPDGEGCGWADCNEQEATAFIVWDMTDESDPRIVECSDTREKAEQWVEAHGSANESL